jgi:RNA polymerase sigma-70 factor (ECF subfamily)
VTVERMNELDREVLERCRNGDAGAFRLLVRVYADRVFALCAALGGSDAEDLAQETFARVHRALGGFDWDGPATLGTWILRISRRLCHDRARGARLRLEQGDDGSVAAATASGQTPEQETQARRLGERLRRAIADLPAEQRAVLALREWDGLEYEAIAAIEGVPVGTVRSRLARARATLRAALADDAEERRANG